MCVVYELKLSIKFQKVEITLCFFYFKRKENKLDHSIPQEVRLTETL